MPLPWQRPCLLQCIVWELRVQAFAKEEVGPFARQRLALLQGRGQAVYKE
ncbi:putative signal peptide protein [Puccinia sorghi]|uniref:Putative signal peptide protein n=1 Tax=Puccinia sorghi TaxID=27349 RepID=A0A0L6U9P5_9BASI|nr:putative signal peptide protein [Puccinia sorghi]